MNADVILDAFENVEDQYIMEARERSSMNRTKQRRKYTSLLIAAVIALLALCGFAAYEAGLFDSWLQKPSAYPMETVQSAIEGQIQKEYTVVVRVDEISVDEAETRRMIGCYTGSELAQARGWTDDYLAEHFLAVRAKYYVEYDHIEVYETQGVGKSRTQRIAIHYRFVGYIDIPAAPLTSHYISETRQGVAVEYIPA